MRYPKGMSLIETDKAVMSRLYETNIVEFDKVTKCLTLRSGGWYTMHTKKCINLVLTKYGLPFTLKQISHQWRLVTQDGKFIDFTDGIKILI